MEKQIDFVEIAKNVVLEFKAEYDNQKDCDFVGYQLYVSIMEDGSIQTSTRPNVLSKGKECLIILTHSDLAVTNYYRWYVIKYIDENGNVHNGYFSNGWHIEITSWGQFSNQILSLSKDNESLFSESQAPWENPWDEPFHRLWDFYQLVSQCSSMEEVKFIADNYELKEKIKKQNEEISALDFVKKKLEMERDQYRSLFKEMKEMIKGDNK